MQHIEKLRFRAQPRFSERYKGAQSLTHTRLLHTPQPSQRRRNDTRCRRMTTTDILAAICAASIVAMFGRDPYALAESEHRFHPKRVFGHEKHNPNSFPGWQTLRRPEDSQIVAVRSETDASSKEALESLTSVVDGLGGTYYYGPMPSAYPLATFTSSRCEIGPAPPTGSMGRLRRPRRVSRPMSLAYTYATQTSLSHVQFQHDHDNHNYFCVYSLPEVQAIAEKLSVELILRSVDWSVRSATHRADRLTELADPGIHRASQFRDITNLKNVGQSLCDRRSRLAVIGSNREPTTSKLIQQTNAYPSQTQRHERQFQPCGPQEWRASLQTTKTSIGSIISSHRKTQFHHNQKTTSRRCSPQSISSTI